MSVVVHYELDPAVVHESLIALVHSESTDAAYLSNAIVQQMHEHNLLLDTVVGQCHDDACNMTGQYIGVQAQLKDACSREPIYGMYAAGRIT